MHQVKAGSTKSQYVIGGLAIALTIALCVVAVLYWEYIKDVSHYGYLGVFVISIFAGATVLVPIPGIIVVFTMGSILHPAVVGVVSGLGEAAGSIGIYLSGYSGRGVIQNVDNHRVFAKFSEWVRKRGSLAVFFMSAVLNPLFYPFTVIAGMLRFGLVRFFFLCWGGKSVKNAVIAYAGFFGLRSLLRWAGIMMGF